MTYDKIVLVTRKTRLANLIDRFNTMDQARFYLEQAGLDFSDYAREDDAYQRALVYLKRSLELRDVQQQTIDRSLLPTFRFAPGDLVVTLGGNGLVANTAKYVGTTPIVSVNPEPERFDAILVPFAVSQARTAVEHVISEVARTREVTLAQVDLSDGQRLLAFNDFFVGARTHVSSRYRLTWSGRTEDQSSSGIIVSTAAGSTGWLTSIFNMAAGVSVFTGGTPGRPIRLDWNDPRLVFAVREPFVSQRWSASIVAGLVEPRQALRVESMMSTEGVLFSDGVESDYLAFGAGLVATIQAAPERVRLVCP